MSVTTTAASPAIKALALIGGSSFLESRFLVDFTSLRVETEFGGVVLLANAGRTVYFVQRHAADPDQPYSPPHLINKRAIVRALEKLGCARVIAFGSVGALHERLPVGTLLLPDDTYDIAPISLFEHSKQGHLVPGFDAELRTALLSELRAAVSDKRLALREALLDGGVYTQTRGPRFESRAEIRMLAMTGDVAVVGMTCAHEMSLCQEAKLPYALVCMIDNYANGVWKGAPLTTQQFHDGVKQNLSTMEQVLAVVLDKFTPTA